MPKNLRDPYVRYGDIFCHDTLGHLTVTVCDLEALKEILSEDAAGSRFLGPWEFFEDLKGGTGFHGLVFSSGNCH